MVIEALRYLGKDHVNPDRIAHLHTLLSKTDRKRLVEDIAVAPAWMHAHLRFIAEDAGA